MDEDTIYKIIPRHDTSTNWTLNNPILAFGEYGIEDDTHRVKRGDGETPWVNLRYDTMGVEYAIEQFMEDTFVKKEPGKGLSENDFTNAFKTKLEYLHNYDDTEVKHDIEVNSQNIGNLQRDLAQEVLDRQGADTSLQNQIDAITSASDVVDIVATKLDLDNYDTTKLTDNDVIKVLADETHDDATSYYRWTKSGNTHNWVYVGSVGPYYTQGETDILLADKQDEITSQNLLDADLVDDTTSTHKFTTAEDITKLSGIESDAQVNIIEDIQVNGTSLTPENKSVDIEIPVNTSDLVNDGDGSSAFATESYVNTHGVTFKPFPNTFDTTHTTQQFLSSIVATQPEAGMTYLGMVSLSDMPDGVWSNAEVEVYAYSSYVIYCVMRSADVSPYVWECNSYSYRGWEPSAKAYTDSYTNTNFLNKTNTTSYTPSADYNPATKKYVDDSVTINAISVNNSSVSPVNKTVNITVPTTNDINSLIDAKIAEITNAEEVQY